MSRSKDENPAVPLRHSNTSLVDVAKVAQAEFSNIASIAEFFRFSFRWNAFHSWQIPEELQRLFDLVFNRRPQIFCEIGTREGGTLLALSHALPIGATLVAVDVNHKKELKDAMRQLVRSDIEIKFITGDSTDLATIDCVCQSLGGTAIDFLFIDGSHEYHDVKRDLLNYAKLMNQTGMIALHDIVIDRQQRGDPNGKARSGDVPRLWMHLKQSDLLTDEILVNPEQDGCGIGLVEWSPEWATIAQDSDSLTQAIGI